jgi:hypothetical protein
MTHAPTLHPPRKRTGRIETVLAANAGGRLGFQSAPCSRLTVDHEGIVDNRHRGWTRKADARTPYLKRGKPIRNDRQVSLVSVEDLAAIAQLFDLPVVDPAWLGANVVVSGLAHFSYLPRGTRLFTGDAILTVTDQNAPCSLTGEAIAVATGHNNIKLAFAKRAQGLRGLVAAIEHPGVIEAGVALEARLPAQWIYAD